MFFWLCVFIVLAIFVSKIIWQTCLPKQYHQSKLLCSKAIDICTELQGSNDTDAFNLPNSIILPHYVQRKTNNTQTTTNSFQTLTIRDLKSVLVNGENGDRYAWCRLMITATNVVGNYTEDQIDVSIVDGLVVGTVKPDLGSGYVVLPHYTLIGDDLNFMIETYLKSEQPTKKRHWLSPHERYYFRTHNLRGLKAIEELLPAWLPLETVKVINLYISNQGMITNMHYDVFASYLFQIRGRKRVYLFAPDTTDIMNMYPSDGPLARRSKFNKEWNQSLVDNHPELQKLTGYHITLQPNDFLFIPAYWLHYVETLDDDTWSLAGNIAENLKLVQNG